jgi:hypothetical protein
VLWSRAVPIVPAAKSKAAKKNEKRKQQKKDDDGGAGSSISSSAPAAAEAVTQQMSQLNTHGAPSSSSNSTAASSQPAAAPEDPAAAIEKQIRWAWPPVASWVAGAHALAVASAVRQITLPPHAQRPFNLFALKFWERSEQLASSGTLLQESSEEDAPV